MKFGLVLGAGGVTGWAFHTGVLLAMAEELGIDAGDAAVIIGTSAGSAVGAAVRAGISLAEIGTAVTTPPTPEEQAAMRSELRAARKSMRPLSPRLARHAFPGGNGAGVAVAGLLPAGWFPTGWLATFPGMDRHVEWPDGLWIPAVRAHDGAVVVFGKDRLDVPVHIAAQASSAVPGMFRPPVIGEDRFVDGAVASPTHASLLLDTGVDVAIISAPSSKPTGRPFARHARRRLADEVALLEAAGITTITMRPSAGAVEAAKGYPRRNPGAAPAIIEDAAAATLAAFAAA